MTGAVQVQKWTCALAAPINNATLIVMGLLYGNRDFEKSIVTTVLGGWDADCTGATSGSVAGMMLGANALPDKWMGPFMRGS
jgi:ADP-ribosylglycohydrolase